MAKAKCSVETCENPARTRGWCSKHYARVRANGDPLVVRRKAGSHRRKTAGYISLYRPDHPLAQADGWVREHRLIAWDAGLLTDPTMEVHHINHVRDDNRLENLEAKTVSDHRKEHGAERRTAHGATAYVRGCRCETCRAEYRIRNRTYRNRYLARKRLREQHTP